MNIIQELQQLDPRDPGRWPLAVRVGETRLIDNELLTAPTREGD